MLIVLVCCKVRHLDQDMRHISTPQTEYIFRTVARLSHLRLSLHTHNTLGTGGLASCHIGSFRCVRNRFVFRFSLWLTGRFCLNHDW